MSMTAEKLRQMALSTGATLKINGKSFNAAGLKLAQKKPEAAKVEPEELPDEDENHTLELVSLMLANTIKEVAKQQGLDHAALVTAIAKLQPEPRPIYSGIVPVRNTTGTVIRYDLITKGN